nr:T-box protein 2-like [Leptinotarsa decemlineata]
MFVHKKETFYNTFFFRRLFPALNIQVSNLDPKAYYCIWIEMMPSSNCRYKYGNSGGWTPAGTEEAQSPQRVYLHPESPSTGKHWMSQTISFSRLKLTNSTNNDSSTTDQIVLSSMHKYQPRIIIAQTSDATSAMYAPSSSVVFPETEFIAVTAYQNEQVTKLKIDNNPFAKGFRKNGRANCKRKRQDSESQTGEEPCQKQTKVERLSPVSLEDDHRSSSSCSTPSSTASLPPTVHPQRVYPTFPTSFPCCLLPTQQNCFPYYTYPVLPVWNLPVLPVPHVQNGLDRSNFDAPVVERPRRLTDFSIRAIVGCN